MMNSYFQYIIEVSFGLILFYGLYYWFLRKETCLNYKRFYLLITPILSLLLPFLRLPNYSSEPSLSYSLDFVSVSAISSFTSTDVPVTWNIWDTLGIIYLTGAAMMLFVFIVRLGRLLYSMYGGGIPKIKKNGFYLRPTQGTMPTFSFLNHLFLDELNTTELEQPVIIEHEQVHIRQKHSYDVIFLELLKIFLWFNPVSWWYRKDIEITHENIADAYVSNGVGLEKYIQILAGQSLPKQFYGLTNNFKQHSTLKRVHILKHLNRKVPFWKYLIMIPGLAAFDFLPSFPRR